MLSAAEWCFARDNQDDKDVFTRLWQAGYDAIEMVPPARRSAAKQSGLKLLNLSAPGVNQGLNRRENHATLLPRIRDTISEAADHAIPQVIVFSGDAHGLSPADGISAVAHGLSELAPFAEEKRVVLTLEVFNTFDHPGYQACYSQFAFDVISRVKSPSVKVLYDIYHMHRMGEDVLAAIRDHIYDIAHFHIAASPSRSIPRPNTTPNYLSLLQSIRDLGYRGYYGLEFTTTAPDPIPEYVEAGRIFSSYL